MDLMTLDVLYKCFLLHHGSLKGPKLQSESIKREKEKLINRFKI